jgi:hypothetical protein
VGKTLVNNFSMALSSIGKKRIILKSSMIKGKKEIMIKKAACAEKAAT